MQTRHFLTASLLAISASFLACSPAQAGSSKPKVTVRFHTEANARDGSSFSMPIKLQYQRRDTYLKRVPDFSERNIRAIYPFRNSDNTWGCAFKLDEQGRIRLETMSSEAQGSALVVFIGTKEGQHQVIDMKIDKPVLDGIIMVPKGMTDLEILVLKQQFVVMGEEKKKKGRKEEDPTQSVTEPGAPDPRSLPAPGARTSPPPPSNRYKPSPKPSPDLPEPALPRVAD